MAEKIQLTPETKYAVRGKVVTFNESSEIIDDGVLYISGNTIVAVRNYADPAPDGFRKSDVINCGGTLYPGMIELHNHLSYNIIPMWDVPKAYGHRGQWGGGDLYRKTITGPLKVLGHIDGYLQAIVRYVECRLLFSGITASQGITLASHGGITKFYRGIVRNVERTVDEDLESAKTKIADITDAPKLLEHLEKNSCYILHLAEGTQEKANKHFRALQLPNSMDYAITDTLVGIHAVGLFPEDFRILAQHKGGMVWSPMSNLLLYGVTADIAAAHQHGVVMGLGSDWTPSGSKNILEELKVAKLVSDQKGGVFNDEELCRMTNSNPARMLKWSDHLGSLAPGKKADFLVLTGKGEEEYERLIKARESSVSWTVIGGVPRCGQKRLMNKFDIPLEKVSLGKVSRYLYLKDESADNPIEIKHTYEEARTMLEEGMKNLPSLTKQLEDNGTLGIFGGAAATDGSSSFWFIETEHENHDHRHHIPFEGVDSAGSIFDSATPLSELIIEPRSLDKATILGDSQHFKNLALQRNLPEYIKTELPLYYGQKIKISDAIREKAKPGFNTDSQFEYVVSLANFRNTQGYMNMGDKVNTIDQAICILEMAYVHLAQKTALYAANPIMRLRVIKQELLAGLYENDGELDFHERIIEVFNSVRDLHTMYQLPIPYKDKVAFLPFFVEQYHDDEGPKFIISKILGDPKAPFEEGVQITHWNGVSIERAILNNAKKHAGSNEEARFARGLDSLTFRPLAVMLPPEEDWVSVRYLDNKGRAQNRKFKWFVGSIHSSIWHVLENEQAISKLSTSGGYDFTTELVHKTKLHFFAPEVAKKAFSASDEKMKNAEALNKDEFSAHFKTMKPARGVGYIRIYSFNTARPMEFALHFKKLLESFKTDKIIVDIRNNGGGHLWASEFVLQTLKKKLITPQNAQFVNSEVTETICRIHSPSSTMKGLDLKNWYSTLSNIRHTGTAFSIGYPITPVKELKTLKGKQDYKVVLITDALCYSASDTFAAGFQDENMGKIIGVHKNTGAGGANVWTHSLLHYLTRDDTGQSAFFRTLEYGADIRVAIRRTLRNGVNRGVPLEDLGIVPDEVCRLTKHDLLFKNRDLLARAVETVRAL
ncbi:MAG: S41 family peptidase [Flavobacteriaceae bacterium]